MDWKCVNEFQYQIMAKKFRSGTELELNYLPCTELDGVRIRQKKKINEIFIFSTASLGVTMLTDQTAFMIFFGRSDLARLHPNDIGHSMSRVANTCLSTAALHFLNVTKLV